MQIPPTPLKLLAGFLSQPPAGSRPQIDPALQAKANAQRGSAPVRPAAEAGPRLARIGANQTLAEAVSTLRAEGRLPPRGSLLDIRA
jgi:hypothetical protein